MRALSLPLILLLGFSPFSSASTPEPLKAPYAPLMSPMGIENPLPTDADIAQMVQTFQFVNSHNGRWDVDRGDYGVFWAGPSAGRDAQGKTRGEKAKELNPKFALSNYRMSQYTQQACSNEAAEVEKRFPLGISVSETSAKLANHISSAKDTTILVIPPERTEAQKDLPAIYPFKVSTTDEEYSTNPKKCVTWFRIGDEILRIDKAQPKDDLIELTVQRGYWGTKAVSH